MEEYTKKYYKIGEVAKLLNVPASTVRYWEKEFSQVKPMKNKKGDRIFNLKDIETLKEIKFL
ncbi:MAG: MerR family transcriptional regulator, partial [Bacteroidia bacterium]|nr:MerR family transcriptional regulator [Bacteroidia bacterium]